jgi:hypothetical protein
MYDDKEFLYSVLRDIWETILRDNAGIPLEGPLFYRRLNHKIIDVRPNIPILIHGPAFNTLDNTSEE